MINAYPRRTARVTPSSSLVTGYDFVSDAATAVQDQPATGDTSARLHVA